MCSQSRISFENPDRQIEIPFIIYVHFDSLQVPQTTSRSTSRSTLIVHKPCGFAYSVRCSYDETLSKYGEYVGEDSPRVLWKKLQDEASEIIGKLQSKSPPQNLTVEESHLFATLSDCHLCRRPLGGDRREDFHPFNGRFLGAGHRKCVAKRKVPAFIPVVMQNFGKYGSNFLKKVLSGEEKRKLFPPDQQTWGFSRGFSAFTLRFLDSRQFMDEKIEVLESVLADAKKRRLKKEFKKKGLFDLMKKKNYFPYRHMDCFERFQDEALPSESGFFDQLHDEEIPQEAYQRSLSIWKHFNCETMADYFRVYAKSNVLLLEDVFENFRDLCLKKYCLDPAHYCTVASFAWDSMLRFTGVELELLSDQSMIDFITSNIRGGINQCSKRHAEANNKYCHHDRRKRDTFIVYLDANNLGGWAMSQNLPFSNFTWMSKSEIETIRDRIRSIDDEGDLGYIFEVDLDYPKTLHKRHNDLPFCLERRSVPMSSKSPNYKQDKSILSFFNKTKYVIEYRTLKQCLDNGLVLKTIHRGLKFQQSPWLQPYIAYNTKLRARARNDFETKFFKLLNNSIYGKTIQKTSKNKPKHAGFSILELSKKFMYDFHYEHMLPKYKDKIDLLYIDTDGVIYEIQTSDYYEDLRSDPNLLKLMDTSNLDPRWKIPPKNKKVAGKMKDEYGGRIIREFFGVGAKMYFLDVDGEEVKKAAGVKKYVKAKYISKDDYRNCVYREEVIRRRYSETYADGDEVKSQKKTKVMFSPGDNKRTVLENKINTQALGYKGK